MPQSCSTPGGHTAVRFSIPEEVYSFRGNEAGKNQAALLASPTTGHRGFRGTFA